MNLVAERLTDRHGDLLRLERHVRLAVHDVFQNLFDNVFNVQVLRQFFRDSPCGCIQNIVHVGVNCRGGMAPVLLKNFDHFVHGTCFSENDANLSACLQFQFAQTLATKKSLFAITQDGADMQTKRQLAHVQG